MSKKNDDKNNIRPISISNCFSQIFEKVILQKSPLLLKMHKNQFGFKRHTSCNHAIFVTKETILNYIEKQSSCKIASLDAEKAFDKVWRDGMFLKLIGKLDLDIWLILKKYYDSSRGCLFVNGSFSEQFIIRCGVKQGGILSPFLFNAFIDDLISECVDLNIGGLFRNLNVSIIVYADDILLISPIDKHLQLLLDKCSKFGDEWHLKFNPLKSHIISFGKSIFTKQDFFLNQKVLTETDNIKYLGTILNSSLDFDALAMEKFKKVKNSIFALSFIGLKPNTICPFLQSFIYKTFCLSTFTYALEATTLKTKTMNYLNICQNDCICRFLGISRYSHMSNVLKCLKIFNFDELYLFSKISFLNSIKNNDLSYQIFGWLCSDSRPNKNSKSFKKDIVLIENKFNMNIDIVFQNVNKFKIEMKKTFDVRGNGICSSILTCLYNYNNKFYKFFLSNLIKFNQ